MSDVDIIEAMQRTGSQKRYRPVGASTGVVTLDGTRVQRASRTTDLPVVEPTTRVPQPTAQTVPNTRPVPKQEPRRTTQAYQQLPNTDRDVQIAPSLRRSGMAAPPTRHLPREREPRSHHPFTMIGGTVAALALGWFLSTTGASLWATHITDPGTYGPTHGSVITGVLGGDSTDHPSKLIAFNNDGTVEVMKITANDPRKTQLLIGVDLHLVHFPDAVNAELQIEQEHQDLTITVWSSTFDRPFHRYSQVLHLKGDGKGNFKVQSLTGGQ